MIRAWAALGGAMLLGGRPKLGTLHGARVTAQEAPETFAVIQAVAQELRAPMPDVVTLVTEYNAFMGRPGFPPRQVLMLGIPLMYTLAPQQRVALIAHELAHEVNGDPLRGHLIVHASHVLNVLIAMLHVQTLTSGPLSALHDLSAWLMRMLSLLPQGLLWTLVSLTGEDNQRAEFRADLLGARIAGTEASLALLEASHFGALFEHALHKHKRMPERPHVFEELAWQLAHASPATLHAIRERVQQQRLRLHASHPPTPDRMAVVAAHPVPAALVLDHNRAARMVEELNPYLKDAARAASLTYEERLSGH